MPNTKSAAKRMKTSEQQHVRNHAEKTRLSTTRRKLYASISAGDVEASRTLYTTYCSYLDKAVKHGVIAANNASRRKSRATLQIAKLA